MCYVGPMGWQVELLTSHADMFDITRPNDFIQPYCSITFKLISRWDGLFVSRKIFQQPGQFLIKIWVSTWLWLPKRVLNTGSAVQEILKNGLKCSVQMGSLQGVCNDPLDLNFCYLFQMLLQRLEGKLCPYEKTIMSMYTIKYTSRIRYTL